MAVIFFFATTGCDLFYICFPRWITLQFRQFQILFSARSPFSHAYLKNDQGINHHHQKSYNNHFHTGIRKKYSFFRHLFCNMAPMPITSIPWEFHCEVLRTTKYEVPIKKSFVLQFVFFLSSSTWVHHRTHRCYCGCCCLS